MDLYAKKLLEEGVVTDEWVQVGSCTQTNLLRSTCVLGGYILTGVQVWRGIELGSAMKQLQSRREPRTSRFQPHWPPTLFEASFLTF